MFGNPKGFGPCNLQSGSWGAGRDTCRRDRRTASGRKQPCAHTDQTQSVIPAGQTVCRGTIRRAPGRQRAPNCRRDRRRTRAKCPDVDLTPWTDRCVTSAWPVTASSGQNSPPLMRLRDRKTKPSGPENIPIQTRPAIRNCRWLPVPAFQRSRTEEHHEPIGGSRWALRILRTDRTSQPQHRRQVALELDPRAGVCLCRRGVTSTRSISALAASRSSGP